MSLPTGYMLTSNKDFILLVFNGEVKKEFVRGNKTAEEMVIEIDKFVKDSNGRN